MQLLHAIIASVTEPVSNLLQMTHAIFRTIHFNNCYSLVLLSDIFSILEKITFLNVPNFYDFLK